MKEKTVLMRCYNNGLYSVIIKDDKAKVIFQESNLTFSVAVKLLEKYLYEGEK